MVATVQTPPRTDRECEPRQPRITCRTCKLKKCIGRCQWVAATPSEQLKALRGSR